MVGQLWPVGNIVQLHLSVFLRVLWREMSGIEKKQRKLIKRLL